MTLFGPYQSARPTGPVGPKGSVDINRGWAGLSAFRAIPGVARRKGKFRGDSSEHDLDHALTAAYNR